jgi:hypothetical protein
MSGGKTKYEILSAIDSGVFFFQPKDSADIKKVIDFQFVVNAIKNLEKEELVKVYEYHLSKKFPYRHPRPVDKILVENLTREGERQLNQLNFMKQAFVWRQLKVDHLR